MAQRCPDCGAAVEGGEVCERCGAFDFAGLTSWVCFPCGEQNAHGAARCACGRERSIACGGCGADVPFASTSCPRCATPRFAFDAAERAQDQVTQIKKARATARSLALAMCPVALAGIVLLTAPRSPSRLAGGGLVALSLAGEAWALLSARQARKELQ